jgi:hypothetical protein
VVLAEYRARFGYNRPAGPHVHWPVFYRGGRTLSWLKVKQRDYRAGERGWNQRPEPV